jgi:hypothetical protein
MPALPSKFSFQHLLKAAYEVVKGMVYLSKRVKLTPAVAWLLVGLTMSDRLKVMGQMK